MKKDSLGDRMKDFESRNSSYLTPKIPVMMRLDGKAFHTFTKGSVKPFDKIIIDCMAATTEYLMNNIQGAKVGYCQSDEISILITDFENITTDRWYDYNIQKMTSISAAFASTAFTISYNQRKGIYPSELYKLAHFDSRVFNIPKEDVMNCFRWRYQDWLRNSIQMLAQSLYSHKELQGKKTPVLNELCFQKGQNWNDLDPQLKNGTLFIKETGKEIQKFTDFNLNSNDFCDTIFNNILYKES